MKYWLLALGFILSGASVWADDFAFESERDPAAVSYSAKKRNYPGGSDEEDLKVQSSLADAQVKTDSRSLQREVFKSLFNQELKDEREDAVEE
jgi:hypothetical protein